MATVSIFKQEIQRSALKKILILISVGAILFVLGLFLITYVTNEVNARNNLEKIKETFIASYQYNEAYLKNPSTNDLAKQLLLDGNDATKLENSFRRFDLDGELASEMILTDTDWNILYTSYSEKALTSYLHNYNNAICYNARKTLEGEIYNAVYLSSNRFSDYIFVKPVFDDDEIIGYMSLYLLGSEWNYYMSEYNFDGVVTDKRDNIIFFSRTSLITNKYIFETENSKLLHINEHRYWNISERLNDYEVNVHSLVYYPKNSAPLLGLLVISIMSFLWYHLANQMAASMAEKNAQSINTLVDEMHIIRTIDQNHRVEMTSGDEFEDVGIQINYMLDTIGNLNEENTELIHLNNVIEMNQLTAQMNPHFLYNTLEIIRNLALSDRKMAEEIIIKLTQVLRYSINNTKRDVRLEEDMIYINEYLYIQKCRFGDRFACSIDIEDACGQSMVPKLLLQPIIENSIKYGFKKKMNIRIEVKGSMKGNMLYLSVKDDGMGMAADQADILNEQINRMDNTTKSNGLHNIARRLFLKYGEESGMVINNEEGLGFEVIFKIIQDSRVSTEETIVR